MESKQQLVGAIARNICFSVCMLVLSAGAGKAQSIITTVAGGGPPAGVPAITAGLPMPRAVARDNLGNLYFTSDVLYKVDGSGLLNRVVSGLVGPLALAVDPAGSLLVADDDRIKRIDINTGSITVVAGIGFANPLPLGDGGPATSAGLQASGIAVDGAGNIFIVDVGHQRIRRVDSASGIITTVAGNGTAGFNGDGIAATAAELNFPESVTVDSTGNLFIADYTNGRLRRVDGVTGVITTVATGAPTGVSTDSVGNAYFTDQFAVGVRRVDAKTLLVTTVAGNGKTGPSGDGGPALAASFDLSSISGLFVDGPGNILIADTNNFRIRQVLASTGIVTTLAGSGTPGDGGPATLANLGFPEGVAVDAAGNILIPDQNNSRVRRVDNKTGIIATIVGGGPSNFGLVCQGPCGDGGPAVGATLNPPSSIATDSLGNMFIGVFGVVRRVDAATGGISTVAGSSAAFGFGYSGDGGPATSAKLSCCVEVVALDSHGNLLISDENNQRIRKVDSVTGIITTIAGNGTAGFNGDGIVATSASLNFPFAIAVDAADNIFIADAGNQRVRRVDGLTGVISTVAGNGASGFFGSKGDGGPALAASLNTPQGLAFDGSGNLFIGEQGDVRRVDAISGIITTVVGNGSGGFSGDGGLAANAGLGAARGLAFDSFGNLFIADTFNSRIRKATGIGVPPSAPCTFSLSPTSQSFGPQGGSGFFTVSVTGGCSWKPTTPDSWIQIVHGFVCGPPLGCVPYQGATVYFNVASNNTGTPRTGSISIGNTTFTVNQSGANAPCSFQVSPSHAVLGDTGGSLSVGIVVTSGAGCQWQAVSNASWLTVTSRASGMGNAFVRLSAAPNTGGARAGTATVAGQTITVSQGGGACGALDVTALVAVHQSGRTPIPWTNLYSQTITVRNNSGSVINGPIYLVTIGEPTNFGFPNDSGLLGSQLLTHCFSPQGDYLLLLSGNLQPGQTVGVPLVWFEQSFTARISFSTVVLSGTPTH